MKIRYRALFTFKKLRWLINFSCYSNFITVLWGKMILMKIYTCAQRRRYFVEKIGTGNFRKTFTVLDRLVFALKRRRWKKLDIFHIRKLINKTRTVSLSFAHLNSFCHVQARHVTQNITKTSWFHKKSPWTM